MGSSAEGVDTYVLSGQRGRPLVLAFYPADRSVVCTRQLCSYQSDLSALTDLGASVWGISPQGIASHESFAAEHGLTFPLLADTDRAVARRYGVDGLLAVKRSVFVIDPAGVVRWRSVSGMGLTFESTATIAQVVRRLSAVA